MRHIPKDIFALFGTIATTNQIIKIHRSINHSRFILGALLMCSTLVQAGEIGSCVYNLVHKTPVDKTIAVKILDRVIPPKPDRVIYTGTIRWEFRLPEKSESNSPYLHYIGPKYPNGFYFKVEEMKDDKTYHSLNTPVEKIKALQYKEITNSSLGKTYPQMYLQSFVADQVNQGKGTIYTWGTEASRRARGVSMSFTKIEEDTEKMQVNIQYDKENDQYLELIGENEVFMLRELRIFGNCRIEYYTHNYNDVEHEGAKIKPFVIKHLDIIDKDVQ